MVGDNHHGMMVHVPPWTNDTTLSPFSPHSPNATIFDDYAYFLRNDAALRHYLEDDLDPDGSDFDITSEPFSSDTFRIYDFKVRKCARARSHDWTDCPYAHPGEKARRRDPRKYSYSGTACPEFRKGNCKKGDGCEFAHGVFECWLHPHRYRTQPCKDGVNCLRRVCFFAHTPEQLRVMSPRADSTLMFSSEGSTTPPSESPPMSPVTGSLSRSLGSVSVTDMLSSLRRLQLNKTTSPIGVGAPWGMQMGRGFNSPGLYSLPTTPTRPVVRRGLGFSEIWEEPVMERVESGRDLRARVFEKLSKENPLDRADPNPGESSNPDVGWISELVN